MYLVVKQNFVVNINFDDPEAVCVMMFVQGFLQIGPFIKEEKRHIYIKMLQSL